MGCENKKKNIYIFYFVQQYKSVLSVPLGGADQKNSNRICRLAASFLLPYIRVIYTFKAHQLPFIQARVHVAIILLLLFSTTLAKKLFPDLSKVDSSFIVFLFIFFFCLVLHFCCYVPLSTEFFDTYSFIFHNKRRNSALRVLINFLIFFFLPKILKQKPPGTKFWLIFFYVR